MKRLIALLTIAAAFPACSGNEGKVIARVGPEKITETYLQEKFAEISPAAQEYLSSKPGRRQFLDVIIHERLMLIAARSSRVASGGEYREKVKEKEAEMKETLRAYKDFMLTRMWVDDMRSTELKITDEEARDYYRKHPYTVTLAHILLPSSDEAEKVFKKLKAGADFDRTAREYSLDKETVRLPPVMFGEFMPELEDMAFKMRVGETQGVVKTAMGYHIIKKLGQDKAPEAPALERVRKIMEKKKFDAYLARFQEKNKVEVIDENYK
ncbi:MAG: peptidyl-prolyl cis-trans isomerase [Elusimicrobia bacterium]|nr:peptidyl-prolyl cis-trans isomerase [Elusimicrobiota bacterium]